MIRTIITPLNTDLHILIPKDYVGKQIEVLLYASEELSESKSLNQNPKQIKERQAGDLKGKIWMADDFDAPLDDFKDYM